MATQVLDGYPQSMGAKRQSIANIQGPSSYTTGGFTIDAVTFGLTAFDFVDGGTSSDGLNDFEGRIANTDKTPVSQAKLVVSLVSTGAEVANATNLSTKQYRVLAIGL